MVAAVLYEKLFVILTLIHIIVERITIHNMTEANANVRLINYLGENHKSRYAINMLLMGATGNNFFSRCGVCS